MGSGLFHGVPDSPLARLSDHLRGRTEPWYDANFVRSRARRLFAATAPGGCVQDPTVAAGGQPG